METTDLEETNLRTQLQQGYQYLILIWGLSDTPSRREKKMRDGSNSLSDYPPLCHCWSHLGLQYSNTKKKK